MPVRKRSEYLEIASISGNSRGCVIEILLVENLEVQCHCVGGALDDAWAALGVDQVAVLGPDLVEL